MKRVLVALLAVGLVAAAACSGDDSADEGPVKMGFLNGQSGDYGPWGHWALAAAEVAVEELNAGGGVLGRDVELVVEDNGSTPEGAVSGFAELTEVDGIHALGGIESDGMIAIFDTVHELEIPTICSTCGTTELDNTGGEMVFRIIPSDTDNGIVGAQVARDEGYRNVAMLVELSEGTESPANVFKAVFTEQMGGSITEDVRFNAGETTYAAQVAQAFESNPDAVYIAAGFETGVPLLNEWQRRGYADIPLILTTDLLSPEIAEIVSGVEGASAIVGATAYDTENNPAWDAYVPRFRGQDRRPARDRLLRRLAVRPVHRPGPGHGEGRHHRRRRGRCRDPRDRQPARRGGLQLRPGSRRARRRQRHRLPRHHVQHEPQQRGQPAVASDGSDPRRGRGLGRTGEHRARPVSGQAVLSLTRV